MKKVGFDEFGGMRSWIDVINFMYNGIRIIVFGFGNFDIFYIKYERIDVRDVVIVSEFLKVFNDVYVEGLEKVEKELS